MLRTIVRALSAVALIALPSAAAAYHHHWHGYHHRWYGYAAYPYYGYGYRIYHPRYYGYAYPAYRVATPTPIHIMADTRPMATAIRPMAMGATATGPMAPRITPITAIITTIVAGTRQRARWSAAWQARR